MDCLAPTKQLTIIQVIKSELDLALKDRNAFEAGNKKQKLEAILNELLEIVDPAEKYLPELKLREQYDSQVRILDEAGILQELSNGKRGIIDILGRECPVPTYREVCKKLTPEKVEIIKKKASQGFTKMLLVPIGAPLGQEKIYISNNFLSDFSEYTGLFEKYASLLTKLDQQVLLGNVIGEILTLDKKRPISLGAYHNNIDLEGTILYKENGSLYTESQLISDKGSWQFLLVEDLIELPFKGEGKILGGRKQLESGLNIDEYNQKIAQEEGYENETGINLETWLSLAFSFHVEGKGQIDVLSFDHSWESAACWLLGNYVPERNKILNIKWSNITKHIALEGGDDHISENPFYGCRTCVEI